MQSKNERKPALEMGPEEFRKAGYRLVDDIAGFLGSIPSKKVNPAESPRQVRTKLGGGTLPDEGQPASALLEEAAELLLNNSLLNGHPSFFGYITSSAAPIGSLGDLLAATVNPNVSSFQLGPVATEIELQTIRWISEMIGYHPGCGGILVSGGNMANFVCFLAARRKMAKWNVRKEGMRSDQASTLCVYASTQTHTWIQKAADLFGLGTDSIRWIPTDDRLRMDPAKLQSAIEEDIAKGVQPAIVIGTAGSVGTGAVDPLERIAEICRKHDIWFHIDGAYGGFAAVLPDAPADLKKLSLGDSLAVDPHKWLYAPLEAGCALVKDVSALIDTFSYHPTYYKFDTSSGDVGTNFYELGPQNSRGFRALKVWLGLRQAGRSGYVKMIAEDCALARELYSIVGEHPDLEAVTNDLSITTFRYVPRDLGQADPNTAVYLNELNDALLTRVHESGAAFVSNAVVNEKIVLRACVVNFRTTSADMRALAELAAGLGGELDAKMRKNLKPAEKCIS